MKNSVIAGYDGGNGLSKISLSTGSVVMCPSLIRPVDSVSDYEPLENGAIVEYMKGDNSQLEGTAWLTGAVAYSFHPHDSLRVCDDRTGKLAYGLQLFLGCLACLPHRPIWDIALAVSLHDVRAYGTELKAVFNGHHTVALNGRKTEVTIKCGVVEEGCGVLALLANEGMIGFNDQSILLDIGHGTVISSAYSGGKLIHASRRVISGGVSSLIGTMSQHKDTVRALGAEGDLELLRRGLENDFKYGYSRWQFQDVYKDCLEKWLVANLVSAAKSIEPWRDSARHKWVAGGGANLPYLGPLLASKGYDITPTPQLANVRGLQIIAQRIK